MLQHSAPPAASLDAQRGSSGLVAPLHSDAKAHPAALGDAGRADTRPRADAFATAAPDMAEDSDADSSASGTGTTASARPRRLGTGLFLIMCAYTSGVARLKVQSAVLSI